MCGLPYSGKSTFADMLKVACPEIEIIRPSDWYLDGFTSEDEKSEWQIACWGHAIEKANSLLRSKNHILLDTCGCVSEQILALINAAAAANRKVLIIAIMTPKSICAARGLENVVSNYCDKIKKAIAQYKTKCSMIIPIKNDSIDSWRIVAHKVVKNWNA